MFARTASADSTQQCAGQCQANATNCNIFIFDDNEYGCMLGTIGMSYSIISAQADVSSYIDTGKVFSYLEAYKNDSKSIIVIDLPVILHLKSK